MKAPRGAKRYGIAATLSDAVALTAAFGPGTKIGIGAANAAACDILAPAGSDLTPNEALAALAARASQYVLTFGNTETGDLAAKIGPLIELLASASGTGFVAACAATPWVGRSVYQGYLFQGGNLQSDLKRDLAPYIDGRIAVLLHDVIAGGAQAIRAGLARLKEQGVRVALLDAVDEEQCSAVHEAVAQLPVIAGPAWISPQFIPADEPELPRGPIAILSGALHRQTLMQTAIARGSMPVLDLDLSPEPAEVISQAAIDRIVGWALSQAAENPFLITSAAPPDKVQTGAPVAELLTAVADALTTVGFRNFVLNGSDTAAGVLSRLGIRELVAGAAFAGLRWFGAGNTNILIKPGFYGAKNLFLYEFEPQSRLNEAAV